MPLPPTTNFLDMGERSDLVKKSRKLTRVFGETPGGGDMLSQKEAARKCAQEQLSRTAQDIDQHQYTNASRRHSIPVTPDELSESFSQVLFQSAAYKRARLSSRAPDPSNELSMCLADAHNDKLGSRVSFIDLSDEEDVDDEAISPITFAPNLVPIGSHFPPSPSQLSLYEAMTPEQRTEEARRRKREKLAKLHRFLGSRVPTDLVLGVVHLDSSLPPIQPPMPAEEAESHNKQWLRRRRSSSAGDLPSWSDDVDRMKEELNGKEKAINVRRAQKMEKVRFCLRAHPSFSCKVPFFHLLDSSFFLPDVWRSTSADVISYPSFTFPLSPSGDLHEEVQVTSKTIIRRIYTSWRGSLSYISAAKS
jgi:hypothetical protein